MMGSILRQGTVHASKGLPVNEKADHYEAAINPEVFAFLRHMAEVLLGNESCCKLTILY